MHALVRSATVFAAATLCASAAAPAWAETTVSAELQPVNDSGVSGTVTLTANDDGSLTVVVEGTGFVPGQPHAQHIHGSVGGEAFMCPSAENDRNGDGVLTNEEGTGEYGTIFLALTTEGDASADSGLSVDRMPVADASGRIDYDRTLPADAVPDNLLDNLSAVHVVQHGIDVNGNGRYDLEALGPSTFARNLGLGTIPEEATNPASCGVVTGAGAPVSPRGGVQTGGGGTPAVDGTLAGVGGGLIALSALLLTLRSRRRV